MGARFQILHQTPDRITISAPGTSLLSPWLALFIIAFCLLILYSASHAARRVLASEKTPAELSSYMLRFWLVGSGIMVGSLGLFWLISSNSGSIVLDRGTNIATVHAKMSALLPAQSRTVPLDTVQRAILDFKPNSRRIRLLVDHGSDLAYPVWTDRPGQQEAVAAINEFLERTGKP
jgi:hypothetical protein